MLAILLADFFSTIILLGAVQGFIISSLLFFSKKKRQSNRILSVLIFLIALASFNLYGNYRNWFGSDLLRFLSELLPLVIVMPFGPLIYFYVQSVLDPSFKINKKHKAHFYPVIIDLIPSIVVIVFVVGVLTKLIINKPGPWGQFIDDYNVYADIPRWASVTFYVWLSSKYLAAYKQKNNEMLNGYAVQFKWLRQFINVFMIFQVIWLIYLIPYVIPAYTNTMLDTFDWYPIYIPLAVLIYWMGIKGYAISQQQVSNEKKTNGNHQPLSPEIISQTTAALIKAMEADKLFLNPNLNLAILSEHTGVVQKTISAVLNQHLEKSFNEFVNGYRIAEFKERILQPETSNLTIAGIALDCGFNSQATFQRTFKELTSQSPSEYRKMAVMAS